MTVERETGGPDTDARRVCTTCARSQPLSAYYTQRKRSLKRNGEVSVYVGLAAACRECSRAYQRAHGRAVRTGTFQPRHRNPHYRTCQACGARRDPSEYTGDGGRCRACRDKGAPVRRPTTPEEDAAQIRVLDAVAAAYEVTPLSIMSRGRDLETVETRKVAIRALWDMDIGVSLIGRLMGLDHSTVLHHLNYFRRAKDTEKWGIREVRRALGLARKPLPATTHPGRRLRQGQERQEATA